MAGTKPMSIADVEYIAHQLAKKFFEWNEPIPDFGTRFPGRLESCLHVPFQTFERKKFYKGLIEKAAILFYLMIKNHPFQNGNKRIAMTTLFVFLHRNGKWIEVDNKKLYNFAKWVAESDVDVKEAAVLAIQKFLKTYLIDV